MRNIFITKAIIFLIFLNLQTSLFADGLPEDYQSKTSDVKVKLLWQEILATEYKEGKLPKLDGNGFEVFVKPATDFLNNDPSKLNSLNLAPTFDHESDELPVGRLKAIHTFGSVALATFTPNDELTAPAISGLLENFNENILIRLSLAGDPKLAGFTPGMAIKFLVDKQPSRNIMVMPKLEGQEEDTNFFKFSFSNDVPKPFVDAEFNLKDLPKKALFAIIEEYFAFFHKRPRHLAIDFLTDINQKGEAINRESVLTPFILEFRPQYNEISSSSTNDFRTDLANIKKETTLFKVYAKNSRTESGIYIGDLKTRSRFVSSSYGDKVLFFQHHHVEEDK